MGGSSRFKYLLLTTLLVLASINLTRTTLAIMRGGSRLEDLKEDVAGLTTQKDELEADTVYMSTDEYVERRARDDLNLVLPGEKLYIVKGNSQGVGLGFVEKSLDMSPVQEESNIFQWYQLFLTPKT